MEKVTLTKTVLLNTAKMRLPQGKNLSVAMMIFFGVVSLFMAISIFKQFGFFSSLYALSAGALVILILVLLSRNAQNEICSSINNNRYYILLQTIVNKEIDSSGTTTDYVLWLSNGQKVFVDNAAYRSAVIGNTCYFVLLQNKNHFLCAFDAQQYQLDDETASQLIIT